MTWDFEYPDPNNALLQIAHGYQLNKKDLWGFEQLPDIDRMLARSYSALQQNAPSYSLVFPVLNAGKTYWINETVHVRPFADGWDLLGFDRDITAQHENSSQPGDLLHDLSSCDGAIVWHADVTEDDRTRELNWKRKPLPSHFYDKLFAGSPGNPAQTLVWDEQSVPDLAKLNQQADQAVRTGQSGYERNFRILVANQTYWVHERTSIQRQGPARWHVMGIIHDESRQHCTNLEKSQSNLVISDLVNQADCLLWQANVSRTDEPGSFENKIHSSLSWEFFIPHSDLYDRIFGPTDPNAPRAFMWTESSVPELTGITLHGNHALLHDLPGYEHDFHFTSPQGRAFCLHEKASIRRTGAETWNVVGVITDVTAQRETEDALAREKEQLAVILGAMQEGVVTTDPDGKIKFINASAKTAFGCGDEVIGTPIELLGVQRRPDQSVESAALRAIAEGVRIEIPPTFIPGNSVTKIIEGLALPLRNAAGGITGAIVVVRDVTERHRIALELERASKLQAVALLAGGIAHDFNNLLTVISGNHSLVEIEPDESLRSEYLKAAQLATKRASALTQQLLTFAKGGEPLLASTNIADLIVEVTRFALPGSAVQCEFDFEPLLWTANADKSQIGQVIQNLIINANQAMPKGGRIHISARNQVSFEGPQILITVTDTGSGIPESDLPHIFEPYFTTKARGNGLGLATAYSIIKKHKGQLNVQSKMGQGTSFLIFLPALPHVDAANASVPRTPRHFHGRILFLEDEPAIQKATGSLLEQIGFEVTGVVNKAAAVQACQHARAQNRPYELALMDLTIPGDAGGEETLAALRLIDPNLKAIVSSGYSQNPVMANYVAYGFQGVVPKPYDRAQLATAIAQVLDATTKSPATGSGQSKPHLR